MPIPAERYTVRDLAGLPDDGKRYELLDGELIVSPAPGTRHNLVVTRLFVQLLDYLRPLGLGEAVTELPSDISWDDDNLVQPDLFVFRPEELSSSWSTIQRLRLAVEVISPSSGRRDRLLKRRLYQKHGVETYWVVDLDAQLVEQWQPDDERPLVVVDTLRWRVTPEASVVTIDVPALFQALPPAQG
jgi:Uma2 family endonuclease